MGGSSSAPRRITIEEEEGGGVVRVSEDVARRLVGKSPKSETGSGDQIITDNNVQSDAEMKADLSKIQNKYEKKIRDLEKQNHEIHQTTIEQFAKAVEEVEQKFLQTTAAPICDDIQNEVMKCYHDTSKQSLNCSPLVRAYSACVQQQRENILKTEKKQVSAA